MTDPVTPGAVAIAFIGGGNRASKYLQYVIDNPLKAKAVAIVEPNEWRRRGFGERGGVPEEGWFESAERFFEQPKMADAVVISTPDCSHYRFAVEALRRGYHVLLEKPVAATMEQCREIAELARERGLTVSVCHILRYHPYFLKIKEIIDSGELGEVVSISHSESVGVDRSCHSYVRGSWRRDDIATPMILTKFCHDTDLVTWWAGAPMNHIQSYGSLGWFKAENAPANSAERCIHCGGEGSCPYSAVDLYRTRREWIANFDMKGAETQEEMIDRELSEGPYGRCVFHCDNNVVDRQLIAMEMTNGVTVSMAMDLFTLDDNRSTHICLTHGEIFGDERQIETVKFRGREKTRYDFSHTRGTKFHGGADLLIVDDFVACINGTKPEGRPVTHIDDILESHRMCFEADRSRKDTVAELQPV